MASCRRIGGVTFDLVPTDKPPCLRGRPKVEAKPKPKAEAKPKAVRTPRRSAFQLGADRGGTKLRKLPPPVDPSSVKVGDRVTVFNRYSQDGSHGIVKSLPGESLSYGVKTDEPSVHFETGELAGFNRYVQWRMMRAGWLEPLRGWKPWSRDNGT